MDNIIVYSTPTCPFCHMVKNYLTQNNFQFKDINVAQDQQAAQEMVQKSGQMGVPVIDINGNIVVGFDRNKINDLLGL
ncbi:MAG TPA: glutaredoxin family protein [Defluviitaleaceae bacterium]|nr:glutaredoxin family protein [Candidatus Epulonipiscium sp.]HOA79797.1 glutaredoxin family protein [Defluviitaleaceae bacterium]